MDQGYTGEEPARQAQQHGIKLEVVKLSEARKAFVLLPKRWVVERSFGWAAHFTRCVLSEPPRFHSPPSLPAKLSSFVIISSPPSPVTVTNNP